MCIYRRCHVFGVTGGNIKRSKIKTPVQAACSLLSRKPSWLSVPISNFTSPNPSVGISHGSNCKP